MEVSRDLSPESDAITTCLVFVDCSILLENGRWIETSIVKE